MTYDSVATLSGKWWTFLARGIFALILAAFAFFAPTATAVSLVYVFAAYFIISGVAAFIAGFSGTSNNRWWASLIAGPLQIIVGVAVLVEPAAGALSLAFLFAVALVASGALEISSAVALRAHVADEIWSILLGVVTLAVGFYVLFNPGLSLLALVYTVGIYGLIAGVALIGLAMRLRKVNAAPAALYPSA